MYYYKLFIFLKKYTFLDLFKHKKALADQSDPPVLLFTDDIFYFTPFS